MAARGQAARPRLVWMMMPLALMTVTRPAPCAPARAVRRPTTSSASSAGDRATSPAPRRRRSSVTTSRAQASSASGLDRRVHPAADEGSARNRRSEVAPAGEPSRPDRSAGRQAEVAVRSTDTVRGHGPGCRLLRRAAPDPTVHRTISAGYGPGRGLTGAAATSQVAIDRRDRLSGPGARLGGPSSAGDDTTGGPWPRKRTWRPADGR